MNVKKKYSLQGLFQLLKGETLRSEHKYIPV